MRNMGRIARGSRCCSRLASNAIDRAQPKIPAWPTASSYRRRLTLQRTLATGRPGSSSPFAAFGAEQSNRLAGCVENQGSRGKQRAANNVQY